MKKLIFTLVLMFCANSFTLIASDISDAKRDLNAAQKKLSSVISKRDKAQQKRNQLQAEYEEVLAKVAANQDKPKSLAYKDAVKKSNALPDKLEQNAQLIASLNRQVDSLRIVVSRCEAASQAQAQPNSANKNVAEAASGEKLVQEQAIDREDKRDAIESIDNKTSAVATFKEEEPANSKTFWQKVWSVFKLIFWISIGIIVLRILMKIGGEGSFLSSRSSSHSSPRSSGSSDKLRRIADKRQAIAREQEKIARLRASIADRKRNRSHYSDLEQSISNCKQRIASLRADIARIKAS